MCEIDAANAYGKGISHGGSIPHRLVVASRSERAAELSELEFALIVSGNAFNSRVARCMCAAGMPGLSVLDILTPHNVNSREREKSLSEVCLVLNVLDDSHLVSYALKSYANSTCRWRQARQGDPLRRHAAKGGTYAENIARFASPA